MIPKDFKNFFSSSDLETQKVGIKLSKYLVAGDIICLNGEIGAGKTTFTKGVLKGLNYNGDVTSPTFSLINEYNAKFKVIHIDCYREKNIHNWLEIGILDYFSSNNIILIEWAENIKNLIPKEAYQIKISYKSEKTREIEF